MPTKRAHAMGALLALFLTCDPRARANETLPRACGPAMGAVAETPDVIFTPYEKGERPLRERLTEPTSPNDRQRLIRDLATLIESAHARDRALGIASIEDLSVLADGTLRVRPHSAPEGTKNDDIRALQRIMQEIMLGRPVASLPEAYRSETGEAAEPIYSLATLDDLLPPQAIAIRGIDIPSSELWAFAASFPRIESAREVLDIINAAENDRSQGRVFSVESEIAGRLDAWANEAPEAAAAYLMRDPLGLAARLATPGRGLTLSSRGLMRLLDALGTMRENGEIPGHGRIRPEQRKAIDRLFERFGKYHEMYSAREDTWRPDYDRFLDRTLLVRGPETVHGDPDYPAIRHMPINQTRDRRRFLFVANGRKGELLTMDHRGDWIPYGLSEALAGLRTNGGFAKANDVIFHVCNAARRPDKATEDNPHRKSLIQLAAERTDKVVVGPVGVIRTRIVDGVTYHWVVDPNGHLVPAEEAFKKADPDGTVTPADPFEYYNSTANRYGIPPRAENWPTLLD